MKSNPLFRFFGSYGLACALILVLFVLTFVGTLYQVNHGLYAAKQTFFNSWFLYLAGFPIFPGGVLAMSLLTANLIIGGLLRIKWRTRNAGVLIIHFGIIFMLVAGLVKLTNSEEGALQLWPGQQSDRFVSLNRNEVTIWELGPTQQVPQWVIDHDFLVDLSGEASRRFTAKDLPFALDLSGYVRNSRALPKGPSWQASGEVIDGYGLYPLDPDKENEFNVPGLHATVVAEDGSQEKGILWARQEAPWVVAVGDRQFAIDFGRETYTMPFSIRLEEFIKEDHPGIGMAKAYRSRVMRIQDSDEKPVLIQMNEPLREGGLVLFQSSYGPEEPGYEGPYFSVFSVVRNPSDKWPEYSLWVITVGLLLTFGRHLWGFLKQQTKRRAKAAGEQA